MVIMSEEQLNNLEIRVRRLEQLHIWGVSILAFGLIYYIIKNKNWFMLEDEKKLTIEEIKNAQILKIINLATLVSISMLLFYGLGAYKHFKEIKRLK